MTKENKLIILYGSQTGNSQDLAERIWRKVKRHGLNTQLSSFDNFDLNNLFQEESVLLCVCSTTGQGDVPDNMSKFWRFIMRKNIPNDLLQSLKFSWLAWAIQAMKNLILPLKNF